MRSMSFRRLGVLSSAFIGFVLPVGVVQAGAAGSVRVLKFYNPPGVATGIGGFNPNAQNAIPPLGSSLAIRVRLENVGSQFGKPSGATVGRALLQCTVLTDYSVTGTLDGICYGIAHVPDGFLTFEGNGAFSNANVTVYAVTGGVGPYANDRGWIKVVNHKDGSSDATVTLFT
jgi:hypothetical protein